MLFMWLCAVTSAGTFTCFWAVKHTCTSVLFPTACKCAMECVRMRKEISSGAEHTPLAHRTRSNRCVSHLKSSFVWVFFILFITTALIYSRSSFASDFRVSECAQVSVIRPKQKQESCERKNNHNRGDNQHGLVWNEKSVGKKILLLVFNDVPGH